MTRSTTNDRGTSGIGQTRRHWILKLEAYDETAIVKFIKAHYQSSEAPEPNGF